METKDGIDGKVVVITGASSGIGEAIAVLLAQRGAKVVLGARRTDRLKALAEEIEKNGGTAAYIETDVTRRDDLQALAALALRKFGRLDVMVNNAGVAQLSLIDELDVEGWEEMIDINIKGTLYGIAAALPAFKNQGSGHIINIISTAGIKITPTMGVYAGTKNAIRTITEAMRQESQGRWRITGVSPGFVRTPFSDRMKNEILKDAIRERANQIAIPPASIAQTVAFAIEQPDNVDIGDIVVRPAAQD